MWMPTIDFQLPWLHPRAGLTLSALAAMLAVAACERQVPPPALPAGELLVLIRPGTATYFDGPEGEPAGFDADLARLFAARKKIPLRFIPATNAKALLEGVAAGKAHFGAGGLYRPLPPTIAKSSMHVLSGHRKSPDSQISPVLWTAGYFSVAPVLIYNVEGFKPARWRDLAGERVAYIADTGLDGQLAALRESHPDVLWTPMDVASGDALIGEVSDGRLDYAIVASNLAAVSRNVYLSFEVAFPVDGQRELGWVLPPAETMLRDEIDVFFKEAKRNGSLQRLVDRYFGHPQQVLRMDAGILQERIRSILPQYRAAFQLAQQSTGIEWRLLAAIAYQESQWDPLATSETGVRGMMQLTEETARHLGVLDRLDPKLSILAAARYLQLLKDKLPARILEPDRTWLALAAFNIGLGHLEDARMLAQKQKLNPDSWSDVKKTLPLLAEPDYYEQAKQGYARGGMPVAFVDRVRAYYDVLLAQQAGYRPRLQVTLRSGPETSAVPVP